MDRHQQLESRLTPNERAGLAAFVEHLRQRYGDDLLRVRLFGSKARGDLEHGFFQGTADRAYHQDA